MLVASLGGLEPEEKNGFYAAMGTSAHQVAHAYDLSGMGRGVLAVTRRILAEVRGLEAAAARRRAPA